MTSDSVPQPQPITTVELPAALAAAERPLLLEFWAAWCGPCRMMKPELARFAAAHGERIVVRTVDVEAEPLLAATFGVRSIPMLLLFVDGQPVKQLVGAQLGGRLERELAAWL